MLFKKLSIGLGLLEDITGAATDSSISRGTIANNNAAIKSNREAIGQEESADYLEIGYSQLTTEWCQILLKTTMAAC